MKILALAFLGVVGGCMDLKSSYPDRKFFALEASRPGQDRTAPGEGVLRVRRFTCSRGCEGSEMVSRTGDAVYESDFYNAFFVPPSTQVTEVTARWMGASRLFGHVVGAGSAVPETHLLEGNLIALYEDARNRSEPRAVIEVQFMLVRVSTDPPRVILERTYRKDVALPKDDPEAVVRGWNEGLSNLLGDLEQDLSKVDRSAK